MGVKRDRPTKVCKDCQGSRTQHTLDPDGCWCRNCMRGAEQGEDRCRMFVEPPDRFESPLPPVSREVAAFGRRHPEASLVAGKIARLRSGTRRKEVFDLVQKAGARGMTDDEIESVTGKSHQTISAVRNSLMNDGLVVDSGSTRRNRYGNESTVWVVALVDGPGSPTITTPQDLGMGPLEADANS